ncbi:MAG TPA: BlaI/MecI/CopY family transcriptional regulator [Planctomycetaceae bacterium]|nr:BlaI/MecI/CopY family transcriptional regulator [Planctomycetaceae bacterium]
MPPLPPLPKSELEIARIVWDRGEVTVREVLEALPADRDLDFFTVQTYLRRLTDKGYLKVHKAGRNNVYSPKVRKNRVISQMVEDFVHGVFDGDAVPLVQHLLQEKPLTESELDQLQATLDQLKEAKE